MDVDCSAGQNPLAGVLKQFSKDHSLQRDQFVQTGSHASASSSFRSAGPRHYDRNSADLFHSESMPAYTSAAPLSPFALSQLHKELDSISQKPWATEFRDVSKPMAAQEWSYEFDQANDSRTRVHGGMARQHAQYNQGNASSVPMTRPFMYASPMAIPTSTTSRSTMAWQHTTTEKDDTKLWDAQFDAYETSAPVHEPLEQQKQQNDVIHEDGKQEITVPDAMNDMAMLLQDMHQQMARPEHVMEELDDEDDFDNRWEDEFGTFAPGGADAHLPQVGSYTFEVDNPYLSHENPMSEAMALMARQSQGDAVVSLSELALVLEAAIQADIRGGDTKAWTFLGHVQSQNEKEVAAIRALQRAVDLDPANLDALMALAVSYTNESHDYATYHTLDRWIEQKYPATAAQKTQNDTESATVTLSELHQRVTDRFLHAAQLAPDDNMDPDVQVGLGILFYGRGDFTKAIDCFFAAVKSRPDDPLLWNRLGATLANNGRCEEAVEAYEKALSLWPTFVRARYNIGVSCLNIGCYKEAAEHFLSAIATHKRLGSHEGINVSRNTWDMLQKSLRMLGLRDLAAKAVPGADMDLFRAEFDF
ncbi:hypothetical protein BC940DRAFT_302358 [Gongronella butleri]|nr:hypothetical protein BC940DRAFT_302358 [Gongronella butleri]